MDAGWWLLMYHFDEGKAHTLPSGAFMKRDHNYASAADANKYFRIAHMVWNDPFRNLGSISFVSFPMKKYLPMIFHNVGSDCYFPH